MSVLMIATGGTIASRPTADGTRVALDGAAVLAQAAEVGATTHDVVVVDAVQQPSWTFTPAMVEALARRAVAATDDGHVGVVMTHGTDTLEETAWMTTLLLGDKTERAAVVVTGAMRHADHPEPDGPANLADALATVRSPAARGHGALVGMDGTLHHARWATKTDTSALDSFHTVGAAPAGSVTNGVVTLGSPPPALPRPGPGIEPLIGQVHAFSGMDGSVIAWMLSRGARGIVLEGTGAGNVPADLVVGIQAAIGAGVPVVVTSRCSTGPVLPEYGGPGGGRQLADLGAVPAGDLASNKARIALSVAMGADPDIDAVRAWFATLVGGPNA